MSVIDAIEKMREEFKLVEQEVSLSSGQDFGHDRWLYDFDERQRNLIVCCITYAEATPAAGLPGHNLMLIISKMTELLSKYSRELSTLRDGVNAKPRQDIRD